MLAVSFQRGIVRLMVVVSGLWLLLVCVFMWGDFPSVEKIAANYEWVVTEAFKEAGAQPALATPRPTPEAQTKANEAAAEQLTIDARTEANRVSADFETARADLERRKAASNSDERVARARRSVDAAIRRFSANPGPMTIEEESRARDALHAAERQVLADLQEAQRQLSERRVSGEKALSRLEAAFRARSEVASASGVYLAQIRDLNQTRAQYVGKAFLVWAIPTLAMVALFLVGRWIVMGFFGPKATR